MMPQSAARDTAAVKRAIELPAFRRLLAAYTLNELAWWSASIALSLLVYRHTGSALGAMVFFLCASFVPAVIAPMLVARVDQRPVRVLLPTLYLVEAVLFGLLAVLADSFSLVPVLVLTVLDGVIALTARPLVRTAQVAVLAPAGVLRQGNALTNAAFSVCYMVAPGLAGLLVAAGGTVTALLIDCGVFVAIAITIATDRLLPAPPAERRPVAGRARAALAYARGHAAVRTLLGLHAAAIVIFTITLPVEIVFATHDLHTGARGYGLLLSAWGAGAVAGSAIFARWHGLPNRLLIAIGAAVLGAGLLIAGVAPTLAVAVVGIALGGAGNGIYVVSARTALQEAVEEQWMAMMMSFNESLLEALPGAGIVLGGALAALASARFALGFAGAGGLIIAGVVWLVLRPERTGTPGPVAQVGGR